MIKIYVDGACKGNHNKRLVRNSFLCVVIPVQKDISKEIIYFEKIDSTTNNIAEWQALFKGLEIVKKKKLEGVTIYSDSQLVVNQYNGEWKIKDKNMLYWFGESKYLNMDCDVVWISREENLAGKFLEENT